MRTTGVRLAILVVSLSPLLATVEAFADPPDLLRSYQYLPRRSTLNLQGGFAGFALEMPIFGTFDFVTGYHTGHQVLDPYAAFLNVDAEAINLTDFGLYSFDIDQSLNLSGLDGEPLPVGAPFDLYHFEGEDGQGAPIEIFVATIDRWLYMKGSSSPGCCDYFQYEIRALAAQTPFPDFNEDAAIDHADLVMWEDHQGDESGMSAFDFLTWQRDLGTVAPTTDYFDSLITASLAANITAVPEPTTCMFSLLALWLAAGRRTTRV